MPSPLLQTYRQWKPAFAGSVHEALARLEARVVPSPAAHVEAARALLDEVVGTAPTPAHAAFAHGAVGIASTHTHYYDGFALLRTLDHGAGVAVRAAASGPMRIAIGGMPPAEGVSIDDFDVPMARLLAALADTLAPGRAWHMAVERTIPIDGSGCLAAVGMAAAHAIQDAHALAHDPRALRRVVRRALETATDRPFSMVYPIAADAAEAPRLVVVDAATHGSVRLPLDESLGWGLIDTQGELPEAGFHRRMMRRSDAALSVLQGAGFPALESFRDLEHRDLGAALEALPRRQRPVVRYLVGEGSRVQKLVRALRGQDWQMLGALLLMSHNALREDWGVGSSETDFVVEQVQALSIDGMYGATASGGGVIVVGQPYVVPGVLDALADAFEIRYGRRPGVTLL